LKNAIIKIIYFWWDKWINDLSNNKYRFNKDDFQFKYSDDIEKKMLTAFIEKEKVTQIEGFKVEFTASGLWVVSMNKGRPVINSLKIIKLLYEYYRDK